MERRTLLLGAAAALATGPLAAPAVHAQGYDRQTVDALNQYLNGITTMQGDFVQVYGDGRTQEGVFYMRRPGRLRFEYYSPSPITVIADGTWAGVMNRDLNTTDRIPLSRTPLHLLLRDNVNLSAEGAIQSIERAPGVVRAKAIDPSNPGEGSITMIFSSNPIGLQQWITTDSRNQTSIIKLHNVRRGISIDPRKFLIEDLNETSGFVTSGSDR